MEARIQHRAAPSAGHRESIWEKYIFSVDHKIIGLQYLWTGLFMAVVGGFMAYVFRMKLAFPEAPIPGFGSLDAAQYNMLVTNHGAIMIFWVGMPILLAAFGNLLIPLMVGCDDMVFPRLNRLSYQVFFLSTAVLLVSLFMPAGGFNGAWTLYPPLSTKLGPAGTGGWGGTLFVLAVALEFAAFLMGGINFLTTSMNARTKGMSLWDVPIYIWMVNLAVIDFMLSVGPLIAGALMLLADRVFGTGFYDPARGGDPLLFQHLFWFFGHPEVYVLMLPALGLVGEIITTNARKVLFGYKMIVWAVLVMSGLSFVVWAHHQFVAGIDPRMASVFSLTTILISVPVAVIVFCYIATLYRGSISFGAANLWALGMLAEFLIGGVTGIHLGTTTSDGYFHDTYFVVAHFHYTMVPVVLFAMFAAIYHWYPKFAGRRLNETLGKIHFWVSAAAFNVVFIPLFIAGAHGMQRRIADYSAFKDLADMAGHNRLATYALLALLAAQIPFVWNFLVSYVRGEKAGDNPWRSTTLEWACPSPPPHGNFAREIVVRRGPYEYGVKGAKQDFVSQGAS